MMAHIGHGGTDELLPIWMQLGSEVGRVISIIIAKLAGVLSTALI